MFGKSVLVTGGAMGIGRATALGFARLGAQVAVLDVDMASVIDTCRLIEQAGSHAVPLIGSVADAAFVQTAFDEAEIALGTIDILINNAGIFGNRPAIEIDDEMWRRVMSVNLDGSFYCAREAGRRMPANGGGCIINLGSIYGIVAAPDRLVYTATKAAIAAMTKTLAIEWASLGIRVNCVAPGYVDTPAFQALVEEGKVDRRALEARTPQGRIATVDDVAEAIIYLCEDRAAHITGQVLGVDGGWTAYGYL